MRAGLALCEPLYGLAIWARNQWYDRRPHAVHAVSVPVVSVGNLTVGGTGKTPMVKAIARRFREQGRRVAILSRGYGAEQGAKNDEALELEQSLPDVPHLQNPDRVASAQIATEELLSQALVLDDGFQHRRLARDLDIVLLDATSPFGYDHLLPRGTLREPVASLRRAGVVCLTRAEAISPDERQAIRRRVERHAPHAVWCEAHHRPRNLLNTAGDELPLENLANKTVAAFCGIGNPEAFRRTLNEAGARVAHWQAFPDHHRFTAADIASIEHTIEHSGAELVVCTHKDLVKVQAAELAGKPLMAVVVEMDMLSGEADFHRKLDQIISSIPDES